MALICEACITNTIQTELILLDACKFDRSSFEAVLNHFEKMKANFSMPSNHLEKAATAIIFLSKQV